MDTKSNGQFNKSKFAFGEEMMDFFTCNDSNATRSNVTMNCSSKILVSIHMPNGTIAHYRNDETHIINYLC